MKKPIDPSVESDRDLATRIAFAWRELRRGAANNAVREIIFEGDDYSIEPGQFDTLELEGELTTEKFQVMFVSHGSWFLSEEVVDQAAWRSWLIRKMTNSAGFTGAMPTSTTTLP